MSFDAKRLLQFEHNVGEKEKKMRLYAGAALVLVSIFTGTIILLLVGLILIGTGYTGWCPAYSGFGKSTAENSESSADKPVKEEKKVTEEKPVKKEPAKKPVAKKPAAKKTATKKPATKKSADS